MADNRRVMMQESGEWKEAILVMTLTHSATGGVSAPGCPGRW